MPLGRVVVASSSHPWLAIEGGSVIVKPAHGQVVATAVGPQVRDKPIVSWDFDVEID